MASDEPFADPPHCAVCKKPHRRQEGCVHDMARGSSLLHPCQPSRHKNDNVMKAEHVTQQGDPHHEIPGRVKRRKLSSAGQELGITQTDQPDGFTSIIVPDLPLEGDPFGPHWSIEEDAGSYNPPDAPNVDISPKVTQEDWDHVMAPQPAHARRGLHKQDYHWIEPGWLIGKPMFPHQLHDRLRGDLNMIDEEQGGFEPLPSPSLAHEEKLWALPAQTHTFDKVTRTFEPIDQAPKRAQKKSLLTEDELERNIQSFLKEPSKGPKRTPVALSAKDNIFLLWSLALFIALSLL